jgi:capsid protein
VISLAPGEKAEFANPTRPNANFDPFFLSFCRQIGVALELPFELLVKHFTASYSASRAALEMAWQFFRKRRVGSPARLVQPVYEWMMEEAVASGRLARPGLFRGSGDRARPIAAPSGSGRSAPASIRTGIAGRHARHRAGVKTREQVCMERTGGEFEKKNDQLVKEARRARPAASTAAAGQGQQQPPSPPPDTSAATLKTKPSRNGANRRANLL